jgi:hypothetical protein
MKKKKLILLGLLLLFVTIAATVLAAAWMGGTSIHTFGVSEQAAISNIVLINDYSATLTITNHGIGNVTIVPATVDGTTATLDPPQFIVAKASTELLTIITEIGFFKGGTHEIRLTAAKGYHLFGQTQP